MQLRDRDMYGNPITPLGETGYGVSIAFAGNGNGPAVYPFITVFHISDGFRQSLYSVAMSEALTFYVCNVYGERVTEVIAEALEYGRLPGGQDG